MYCRFLNTPPQCKSQCKNDKYLRAIEKKTKVPIMANDHQRLLEATLIHENAANVIQNHKACAVQCHYKRVSSLTV